jgi:SAM-dependent methyltransferase
MPYCTPCSDADILGAARALLTSASYNEEAVCARLGLSTLGALSTDSFPALRARVRQQADALSTLVALLLLETTVPRREAERLLGREQTACLLRSGILASPTPRSLQAAVAVYPCAGALIATDRRVPRAVRHRARRDRVMYLGADSYLLAHLAPQPRAGGSALDLCTGSGVHAVLAAQRGADVVGVDVNPRAIAFARFNAHLNDVAHRCTFSTGDLFEPLARGAPRPMDVILANPPFVPSPYRGRGRLLFRDGGPLGDAVLERIVAGLERHLARDGIAAIVSTFVDQRSRPFRERLGEWLGPRARLDTAFLFTDCAEPAAVASAHTLRWTARGCRRSEPAYRRWLAYLRRLDIVVVRGGLLVAAHAFGSLPPAHGAFEIVPPVRPNPAGLRDAMRALQTSRRLAGRDLPGGSRPFSRPRTSGDREDGPW